MRKTDEWIGATDDTDPPSYVFIRLYRRQGGRCPCCTRLLRPGHITREHLKPISMGGENRETNIQLWCTVPCSSVKTRQEAPTRAKADRVLSRHLGAKPPRRGNVVAGSKASGWIHHLDGRWERR